MTPTQKGSLRLFRFSGVDVYVHWSWALVAVFEIQSRSGHYNSLAWNVLEYLALFAVVLLHEFGHSLACRQVGGQAEKIVLWPLGGVAYVRAPPRPAATLWSIAAGPLVNLGLLLLALGGLAAMRAIESGPFYPNAVAFFSALAYINAGLLIFNLLPIYPLDGGQILRALLWFLLGRARSLMVASAIGFIGVAALAVLAVIWRSLWVGIMALFVMLSCWRGLQHARKMASMDRLPRHPGFACPSCKAAPVVAALWGCGRCSHEFDTFASRGQCPNCALPFETTSCPECGHAHPMSEWIMAPTAPGSPNQGQNGAIRS
jgi:Zn-dependent protease